MSRSDLMRKVRIPIADTGLALTVWVRSTSNRGFFGDLNQAATGDQWARILRTMERYYALLAAELNAYAVEEFKKTRKRPGVSTGRLEMALRDPRNMEVAGGKDGFYVGVDSFLKNSQAKYWRQIDQGTSVHVGRRITGVWGTKLSGEWREGRKGRYALVSRPYTPYGAGRSGKFQPLSTMEGRLSEVMSKHPGMAIQARISRPIPKADYYERAFRRARRHNRAFNLLREVVAMELGMSKAQMPRSVAGLQQFVLGNY